VLLFDKPAGMSSNGCLGHLKRLFEAEKAGHTGTLDPFATGLLPVAFGESAKFSQGLLDADKTYLATMRLGQVTTTADTEGEVIASRPVACDAGAVAAALDRFAGEISQVPPMHSALKRDGRPLYEYARQGIEVAREPRRVTIHRIEFLDLRDDLVRFRVRCSKGTYVRTLAQDIGEVLGCGAHLAALRREAVGDFDLSRAVDSPTLEALDRDGRDAHLLPVDALVMSLPRVDLDAAAAARLRQGQALRVAMPDHALARAYADEVFLGTVGIAGGVMRASRLLAST
jgi:tRNA pseudouridine55 synthase